MALTSNDLFYRDGYQISGLDRFRLNLSGRFNFTFQFIICTGLDKQCRPLAAIQTGFI